MKRIDLKTWERREQYPYYSAMDDPFWGMTCEIEVTRARVFMKDRGIPAYVGLIYLVTRAVNAVAELRTRVVDDAVYAYDVVHPSCTLLDAGEHLRFCAARYDDDPAVFIAQTRREMERVKNAPTYALAAQGPDRVYCSCLPWVHFTGLTHPAHRHPPDTIPRVTWGAFTPRATATVMAVNIQVHHGLADGLHVSRFMRGLADLCAAPETVFDPAARRP